MINNLYLFLLLILYISAIVIIVKKTDNKTGKILYIIIATLVVSFLSNVPVWNYATKSKSAEEAFGKSWHRGEIVNCIENDEIAVITVRESQQTHYYTYSKENDIYFELKNRPDSVNTSIYSDELTEELIMIMRYDCPKSSYSYIEAQIFCTKPGNDIIVEDSNNTELPYYTIMYDADSNNTYTVYVYYSLVPGEIEEGYHISVNGEIYPIDTQ